MAGNPFVQGAKSDYSSRSSIPLAFPSNNALGNMLVVFVSGANNNGITISDTQGNTYVQLFLDAAQFGATNTQAAWYALNCKAGANTVTVSWTTAETSALAIAEYVGVARSSALDQSGENTGNSAAWSTPTKTTTATELILAFAAAGNGSLAASTFTARENMQSAGNTFAAIFDNGQQASGSQQASGTNTSGPWLGYIATFRRVAFVQSVGASTGASQTTSLAKAYTSNNSLGNMLVCMVRNFRTAGGSAGVTVADSAGNTWVEAPNNYTDSSSNNCDISLWYVAKCKAGANTVTVTTVGGTNAFIRYNIAEYSYSQGQVVSYDTDGHATGSSTSYNSGAVTTNGTIDIIFGFVQNETNDADTYTVAAGWTFRQADPSGNLNSYDQLDVAPGSYTFSGTINNSANWAATQYAFNFFPWTFNSACEAGDHSSIVVNSGATSTKAFGAAVKQGDLLLLSLYGNQTNWAVTDDKSNTWTKLLGYSNRGDSYFQSFWYAIANAAGTPTITMKNNSGSQETALQFEMSCFSPAPGTVTVDQTATNTGTSATPSATLSATNANELVIGMQLPFGFPTGALTGFSGTRAFGSGQQPNIYAMEALPGSYTPGVNMSGSNIFSFLAATFQVTTPGTGGGVIVIIME